MSLLIKRRIPFHLLVTLCMLGAVTILFFQPQQEDSQVHYNRLSTIQGLKLWETTLNQEILRNQMGFVSHYGTLDLAMDRIDGLYFNLTNGPTAISGLGHPELHSIAQKYGKLVEEKKSLIESYKSQHTSLSKAEQNLPVVFSSLIDSLKKKRAALKHIDTAKQLLTDILLFAQNPNRQSELTALSTLHQLQTWQPVPDELQANLKKSLTLAQTILRLKGPTNQAAMDIVRMDTVNTLGLLTDVYSSFHRSSAAWTERTRLTLFLLCFLSMGYVGLITVRLSKSTDALGKANDSLEERITGRTAELQAANASLQKEISEHERSEKALRDSEERFRKIFLHSNDAIFVIDLHKERILQANSKAASLLGYSQEELLALPISTIHKNEIFEFQAFIQSVIQNTFGWTDQLTCLTKQGKRLSAEISASSLKLQGNNCIIALVRDVTERKHREDELARVANELELKNHEIAEARDEALTAVKAKSDFLAMMSHEIRTPMNGIIGMSALLLETDVTHDQRFFAETVRNSGESLLAILNDVLDFSKIEAGKIDLETIDFNLRSAVEETVELLSQQAQDKRLELTAFIFPDVPVALCGDPTRLRQVMLNLIGNAIKFTESGEVGIQVWRLDESPEHVVLRFQVADTGIGISDEAQQKLFHSFSQADTSTTRKYGGTGLGLAISKRLIELMNGEIGVESKTGQGSLFWFTVQLGKQSHPLQSSSVRRPDLQGLRVCCVDDHATNRYLLSQYAEDWGMYPSMASTASEALALLHTSVGRGKPYDLVIIDMHMPGMDGLTLAKTIKSDPKLESARLVLLTSLGQRYDRAASREAGFSGSLTKPVRKDQLEVCLAHAMDRNLTDTETERQDPVTRHSMKDVEDQPSKKILVADDHEVNRQLAALILERLGYSIDVVSNGKEALENISRIPYKLVFMDCQMPTMDGFSATQHIRNLQEPARNIPIIALTANAMQGDRGKCLAAGMNDYVTKPFKAKELAAVVARWIEKSENQTEIQHEHQGSAMSWHEQKVGNRDKYPLQRAVVHQFVQDTSNCITALQHALESGQHSALLESANELKNLSLRMGLEGLTQLCQELEQLGVKGHVEEISEKFLKLQVELGQVCTGMENDLIQVSVDESPKS